MQPTIIAIEGIDAAGKNTLATALKSRISEWGLTTSRVSFPRYNDAPWGSLISQFLSGQTPLLATSVSATALAFAADRHCWWQEAKKLDRTVWIVDRYIASNVAYGCSRLRTTLEDRSEFEKWVLDLEISTFKIPIPSIQILLNIDPKASRQRMKSRRPMDFFEMSSDLQETAAAEYIKLAQRSVLSEWTVVDLESGTSPLDVQSAVLPYIRGALGI